MTAAEVLISITALEIAYTQAPKSSTSLVTALFYIGVALGNAITALVTGTLEDVVGGPSSTSFFVFFTLLALLMSIPIGRCAHNLEHTTPR
jgi:POT family proton-dependent oligopeptide transporter